MKRLALILALALIVAACGGADDAANSIAEQIVEQASGDSVDISTSDDGGVTMSFEGEDGSGAVSFSEDLPAGFPFPLPDEYELGSTMSFEDEDGTKYTATLKTSGDDFDAVRDMYASWLEGEGFTVQVDDLAGDTGKFAYINGDRDDVSAGATMSLEEVSNDDAGNSIYATVVTLTWNPKG